MPQKTVMTRTKKSCCTGDVVSSVFITIQKDGYSVTKQNGEKSAQSSNDCNLLYIITSRMLNIVGEQEQPNWDRRNCAVSLV